jgi:V8-like Glu-specific endopeptidase
MRKALALASLAALGLAAGAAAIIGGGPDGNGHPAVGMLLAPQAFSDGTWVECTGTLISPTVFLTAEHCDEGLTTVTVSFASQYVAGSSRTYTGTWHGDPHYRQAQSDPHDIAVVVLDEPVRGIAPARLPRAGSLDALAHGDPITAVGYGAQSVNKGGGKPSFNYQDVRYVATGSVNSITPSWIRASMNPATGDGGTCYGDSGGPNFVGGSNVIGGITITGDATCRATNVDYRLDTASARSFLAQYAALP